MTLRSCFLVGHIEPSRPLVIPINRGRPLALYCSWANHWFTPEDEARHNEGAPTSHGVCPEHAHLLDPRGAA